MQFLAWTCSGQQIFNVFGSLEFLPVYMEFYGSTAGGSAYNSDVEMLDPDNQEKIAQDPPAAEETVREVRLPDLPERGDHVQALDPLLDLSSALVNTAGFSFKRISDPESGKTSFYTELPDAFLVVTRLPDGQVHLLKTPVDGGDKLSSNTQAAQHIYNRLENLDRGKRAAASVPVDMIDYQREESDVDVLELFSFSFEGSPIFISKITPTFELPDVAESDVRTRLLDSVGNKESRDWINASLAEVDLLTASPARPIYIVESPELFSSREDAVTGEAARRVFDAVARRYQTIAAAQEMITDSSVERWKVLNRDEGDSTLTTYKTKLSANEFEYKVALERSKPKESTSGVLTTYVANITDPDGEVTTITGEKARDLYAEFESKLVKAAQDYATTIFRRTKYANWRSQTVSDGADGKMTVLTPITDKKTTVSLREVSHPDYESVYHFKFEGLRPEKQIFHGQQFPVALPGYWFSVASKNVTERMKEE